MSTVNSDLSIFDKQAVQTDIHSHKLVDYHPRSGENTGPFEFIIPGSGEEYIDLNKIDVNIKFKILKADGTDIAAADIVGLNNLPIATLFQDVTLSVENVQIEGGQQDYGYKAYFHTVTQFHPSAQTSHMRGFGWIKDQAAKFDDKANTGFVKRQKLIDESRVCELHGPIYLDFFNQPRKLLANTDLRLKFILQKPEFFLNAYKTTDYKISVIDLVVYARRLLMNPSVIKGHMLGLNSQNALYPINHRKLLTFTVPAGQKSFRKDNLFPSESPKLVIVAMVSNLAFNGDISLNPYNFQHFNLEEIALLVNGKSYPGPPYRPDFDKKLYARDYMDFMEAFGYYNSDDTNGLTYKEFGDGYTMYAFDKTPDANVSSDYRHPNLGQDIRLDIKFKANLAKTINVLVYACFDAQIEITKLRDIITSYSR